MKNIPKRSINEFKNFTKPPGGINDAVQAVLIFLTNGDIIKKIKVNNTYNFPKFLDKFKKLNNKSPWDIFRDQFLNGRKSFLEILYSYEGDRISDEAIKKIDVLFKKPTLNLDYISHKSSAFAKLCEYVVRMVEYEKLLKAKKPKDKALKIIQVGLEKAHNKLKSLNENINRLEIEANFVISKLNEANKRKSLAQHDADRTMNAISLANRLISGMATEHSRWSQKLEILNDQKKNISTDYLLPVQFLTYAGVFTNKYRVELLNKCLDTLSKNFSVQNYKADFF